MENLTYFANGAACMLFMLASLHFRRKPQNKTFNLVLYYVVLGNFILERYLADVAGHTSIRVCRDVINVYRHVGCSSLCFLSDGLTPSAGTYPKICHIEPPTLHIVYCLLYYYRKLSNFCRQYRICHNVRDCSPFLLCQRDKTI